MLADALVHQELSGVLDNHLLPAFGHRLVTELHAEELQAFLTSRSKAYAYGSFRQFRTAMSPRREVRREGGVRKQNVVRDGEVRVPSAPQKISIPSRARPCRAAHGLKPP